jgi:hypothetical protein
LHCAVIVSTAQVNLEKQNDVMAKWQWHILLQQYWSFTCLYK